MDELPTVVICGLQGHCHLVCDVFRSVKTLCFSQEGGPVDVVTNFNFGPSTLNDWMEIKACGHWSSKIRYNSCWMLRPQLVAQGINSMMDDIDTGKYILPHSFLNGVHLGKIHYLCPWNLCLFYLQSGVLVREKAFKVHQSTLDQPIRMIKYPDSHWIAWDTHHLIVVQSSFQEVGEWAIKEDSVRKGKWSVSIWDVLNHVRGVFWDVIKTKSWTRHNTSTHLPFPDTIRPEIGDTTEKWIFCFGHETGISL